MLFSAVTKTESTTPADTSAQSVMDSARPILNGARVLITAHKVGLPVTATHVAWTYKNLGQVIASIKQVCVSFFFCLRVSELILCLPSECDCVPGRVQDRSSANGGWCQCADGERSQQIGVS
jgi:hypothetical protein